MNTDSLRKLLLGTRLRLFLFLAIAWGGFNLLISGDFSLLSILLHAAAGSLFGLFVMLSMTRRRPYELAHFNRGDYERIKQYALAFRRGKLPEGNYDKNDFREYLLSRKRMFESNIKRVPAGFVLFAAMAILSFIVVQSVILGFVFCGFVALYVAFLFIARRGIAKADRLLSQVASA